MLSKAKEYDKFWNKANSNYELRINIAKLLREKFEIEIEIETRTPDAGIEPTSLTWLEVRT